MYRPALLGFLLVKEKEEERTPDRLFPLLNPIVLSLPVRSDRRKLNNSCFCSSVSHLKLSTTASVSEALRPETLGHAFLAVKGFFAGLEERELRKGKVRKRAARTRSAKAHPGVLGFK
jgi:hypothetical protein